MHAVTHLMDPDTKAYYHVDITKVLPSANKRPKNLNLYRSAIYESV